MLRTLMPLIIFCLIYGILGMRWAKQEREEWRRKHPDWK